MSVTIDQLITVYSVKNEYTMHVHEMAQQTDNFGDHVSRALGKIEALGEDLIRVGVVGAAALVGLGVAAMKTAADFEALKLGLASSLGGMKAAELEWMRVRDVAKLPGLGMEEAAQGLTRLLQAGISLSTAERSLRAFGNAVATVGGGKDDLNLVTLALSQISTKGKVSAEEIRQLAERVPQIRRAMLQAFGTADTEAIGKMGIRSDQFIPAIVAELEKLPKVLGGAKNSFENFGDAIKVALAAAGSALNTALLPALDKVASAITFLADSGEIQKIMNGLIGVFNIGGGQNALQSAIAWLVAALEQLPHFLSNLKNTFVNVFETIHDHLGQVVALFALMGSAVIIAQIIGLAKAIWGVVTALKATAIGEAVVEAFSGPGGLALLAASAVVAAGAIWSLNKGFQNLASDFQKQIDGLGAGLHASDLQKRHDEILKSLQTADTATTPLPSIDDVIKAGIDAPASVAGTDPLQQQIADNTKEIATHTRRAFDQHRYAIGGGQLTDAAAAPVSLAFVRAGLAGAGGGNVQINVPGAGKHMTRAIEEIAAQVFHDLRRQQR